MKLIAKLKKFLITLLEVILGLVFLLILGRINIILEEYGNYYHLTNYFLNLSNIKFDFKNYSNGNVNSLNLKTKISEKEYLINNFSDFRLFVEGLERESKNSKKYTSELRHLYILLSNLHLQYLDQISIHLDNKLIQEVYTKNLISMSSNFINCYISKRKNKMISLSSRNLIRKCAKTISSKSNVESNDSLKLNSKTIVYDDYLINNFIDYKNFITKLSDSKKVKLTNESFLLLREVSSMYLAILSFFEDEANDKYFMNFAQVNYLKAFIRCYINDRKNNISFEEMINKVKKCSQEGENILRQ